MGEDHADAEPGTGADAEVDPTPTDEALRALVDDERRADAVADRRRAHWLGRQASAAGTLAGLLVDLGERRQLVAVTTRCGRPVRGVVTVLGVDFCVLQGLSGERTLVALATIASLRAEPGTGHPVGDRHVTSTVGLAGALADLAAERAAVSVHTAGDDTVTGTLDSVGMDLLTVVTTAGDAVSVPLDAVADVVLA